MIKAAAAPASTSPGGLMPLRKAERPRGQEWGAVLHHDLSLAVRKVSRNLGELRALLLLETMHDQYLATVSMRALPIICQRTLLLELEQAALVVGLNAALWCAQIKCM